MAGDMEPLTDGSKKVDDVCSTFTYNGPGCGECPTELMPIADQIYTIYDEPLVFTIEGVQPERCGYAYFATVSHGLASAVQFDRTTKTFKIESFDEDLLRAGYDTIYHVTVHASGYFEKSTTFSLILRRPACSVKNLIDLPEVRMPRSVSYTLFDAKATLQIDTNPVLRSDPLSPNTITPECLEVMQFLITLDSIVLDTTSDLLIKAVSLSSSNIFRIEYYSEERELLSSSEANTNVHILKLWAVFYGSQLIELGETEMVVIDPCLKPKVFEATRQEEAYWDYSTALTLKITPFLVDRSCEECKPSYTCQNYNGPSGSSDICQGGLYDPA